MFRRLASKKTFGILSVGLAPLLIRALLLPYLPMPQPRVEDEFSHLLIADTFSHGRLVNPAHPLWVHFESMHVLVRPVYAGAFPVAQGVFMAAAQRLTGIPWIGVWLSVGAMCAAICWMLHGWVPRRWALLGGVLVAARYGVLSYWMNSYYGGAVPAIGGALVLGAWARLLFCRRNAPARHAALFAAGLAILANSRPYEGLIFSLPFVVTLLIAVLRRRLPRASVLVALGLVLGATGVAMAYYFTRVTGDPLRLPYSLYRQTSSEAPHFIWQLPRQPPVYHHRVTRHFYGSWEMAAYNASRANHCLDGIWDKAKDYSRFFIGPFLAIPLLLTLPWTWSSRRTRFLILVAISFAAALAVEVWHSPHYAAPATGLAILLSLQAMRQLRLWPHGRLLTGFVIAGVIVTPLPPSDLNGEDRARVLDHLRAIPGPHLVIVRYTLRHDPGKEWVYNEAEIDNSKVVWAREMDPGSNRTLLRYFANRQPWLVEPDLSPPRLSPYDPNLPPDPAFQFVRLGVEAIEVLRHPGEVKRTVLATAAEAGVDLERLNCDQWNYYFTAATGVEPPDVSGCYVHQRTEPVSYDQWFSWLSRQR
ncbi:MAG: hypothetical protein JNN08_04160 [Bryobacterales bacterium]|nr:hypothetical protein [Bryobacterales bacterium]